MLIFSIIILKIFFCLIPKLLEAISITDTSIACDKSDFLLKISFDQTFKGTVQSRAGNPKCIYVNGTLQPDSKYQLKSDFLLKISFDQTFKGTVQSRSGNPKCIYVNGTLQPDSKYQLKIPLKGCSTRENGEGNLENEIEVVHSDVFNIETDKRFLLTCIPAAPVPKESQVTVSFGGITINSDATTASTLSDETSVNKTVDYQVKVLDGDSLDSKPLQRPLAVGDKVTYTVEMKDDSMNGRIGRCWANDGVSELPLSDAQGCSLQSSGEVWGDFEVAKRSGKTIFYNHIKAWAFPTSNEVNIFCNLHVCVTCSQPSCRGRERRHHELLSSSSFANDPFSSSVDISDISPPIAVRTSFRLKRDSKAIIETQRSESISSSTSSPQNRNIQLMSAIMMILFVRLIASSSIDSGIYTTILLL